MRMMRRNKTLMFRRRFALRNDDDDNNVDRELDDDFDDDGTTSILDTAPSSAIISETSTAVATKAEEEETLAGMSSNILSIAAAASNKNKISSKTASISSYNKKKNTKKKKKRGPPITTTEQSLYNDMMMMTTTTAVAADSSSKVPMLRYEDTALLSPTTTNLGGGTNNNHHDCKDDRHRHDRWDTSDVMEVVPPSNEHLSSSRSSSFPVSKMDKEMTKSSSTTTTTTTTAKRIPSKNVDFDPFNVKEFEEEEEFGEIHQEKSHNDVDQSDDTLLRFKITAKCHDENFKDEWQSFSPNDNDIKSNPFIETTASTNNSTSVDGFHREVLEQHRKISSRRLAAAENNKDKKKSIGDTTIHSQIKSLSSEDVADFEDENEQKDENINPFFHHDFDKNTKNNSSMQVSRTEAFLRRIERQRESLVSWSADSNDGTDDNRTHIKTRKIADTVQTFVRRHSTLSDKSTDRNDTNSIRESILSFPEREPAIEFLKKQEQEDKHLQNKKNDVVAETNQTLVPSSSQESGDIFLNLVANPTIDSNASENVGDAKTNKVCQSTTKTVVSIETKLLSNTKTKLDNTEIGVDQEDDEIEVSNHVKITASSDLDSDYGIEVAVDAAEDATAEHMQNPDIVETISFSCKTDTSPSHQTFEHIKRSESNNSYERSHDSKPTYVKKTKRNSDNPMTNLLEAAAPIIGNESIRSIRKVAERFGMALDDATHADMNEPTEEIFHVYSTDTSISSKSSAFSNSNGRSRSFRKHRSSADVKDLESFGSLLDTDSNEQEDVSECHTVMSSLPGEGGPTVTRLSIDMGAIDPASVSGRAGLYHVQQPSACSSKTSEQTESSEERSHGNSYQYQDYLELEAESLSTVDDGGNSKSRQHIGRSKKKTRPLGASFDEIENINKFLSIAGPDFDGSNLSIEEREILHDKALKAGMPEAFINRILDQSAGIITWESYSWLPSIDEDDDDDHDDGEYDVHETIRPKNHAKSKNKQPRHRNLSPGRTIHNKDSSGDQTRETINTSYSDSTYEDDSRYHRKEFHKKKTTSSGVIGFIKTMFLEPPADFSDLYYNASRSFDSSSRQSYHRHHRHKRERDHHRHQRDRDRDFMHRRDQHEADFPSPPREMPEHKRFLT